MGRGATTVVLLISVLSISHAGQLDERRPVQAGPLHNIKEGLERTPSLSIDEIRIANHDEGRVVNMSTNYCLRCETTRLTLLPGSDEKITFYECPSCHRHFAQEPGRGLCDRWLSAISLVLYGIQFEPEPQTHFHRVAQKILHDRSREDITWMIEEIEHELGKPTQQVRDILSLPHEEEDLRHFLRLVVDYWKTSI